MAIPLVEGETLASGKNGAGSGALVRGIRAEDITKLKYVANNIKAGDLVGFASGDGIAIGSRLAATLGVSAGDTVTLISPEGDVTPMGVNPRVKSYKVAAVFEIGMSEYDSSIIFMPLEQAQLYFNSEGIVQSIELFVDNPDKIDELREPVEKAAGRQIFITDWRQRNSTFFSALQVERNVMFMILTLIVLVAALNIISGLIMLVKDKGHDIAILRTMGATSGSVMRIFFMTGAAIGTAGTFAGVILGVVVCLNIERIRQFFLLAVRHDAFQSRTLFPEPAAGPNECRRDIVGYRHGIGAVLSGDDFPGLARRQAGSRPGAEIRIRRSQTR